MSKYVDLTGKRFTRLYVVGPERVNGILKFRCKCDCGKEIVVP